MVEESLDHLLPEIKALVSQDAKTRIMFIKKDNWMGYDRAQQALLKLDDLYSHPKRQRMPNLLIVGSTNNGKTMIIEKFLRRYLPVKKNYRQLCTRGFGAETREQLIEEYDSLLSSMVAILPLKKASNLNCPKLSEFILTRSQGILGEIVTLLRCAAVMAIRSGKEIIDEELLKRADYHSPSERRQLFERSLIEVV